MKENIKFKLSRVWNAQRALGELNLVKDLPMSTSYWIAWNTKKLSKEIEIIEEKRRELVKKYGTENEKKETSVPQEKMEEFSKEFYELLNTDIDMTLYLFNINEFTGKSGMTGQDMLLLDFLFKENDEIKEKVSETPKPIKKNKKETK